MQLSSKYGKKGPLIMTKSSKYSRIGTLIMIKRAKYSKIEHFPQLRVHHHHLPNSTITPTQPSHLIYLTQPSSHPSPNLPTHPSTNPTSPPPHPHVHMTSRVCARVNAPLALRSVEGIEPNMCQPSGSNRPGGLAIKRILGCLFQR